MDRPARPLWSYAEFGAPKGLGEFRGQPTSAAAGGLQSRPSRWSGQHWAAMILSHRGCVQTRKCSVGLCAETTWSDQTSEISFLFKTLLWNYFSKIKLQSGCIFWGWTSTFWEEGRGPLEPNINQTPLKRYGYLRSLTKTVKNLVEIRNQSQFFLPFTSNTGLFECP